MNVAKCRILFDALETCKEEKHSHPKCSIASACKSLFPKIIFIADCLQHLICIGCTKKQQIIMEQKDKKVLTLLSSSRSSEGLVYDEKNDWYVCPNNKRLKGNGKIVDDGKGKPVKKYFSLRSDCKNCPLRKNCISDKARQKKIQRSYSTPLYEAAKERMQSVKGRIMKGKRSSTVESA